MCKGTLNAYADNLTEQIRLILGNNWNKGTHERKVFHGSSSFLVFVFAKFFKILKLLEKNFEQLLCNLIRLFANHLIIIEKAVAHAPSVFLDKAMQNELLVDFELVTFGCFTLYKLSPEAESAVDQETIITLQITA